jgi:hypothetical protein
MTTTVHALKLADVGPVDITVDEHGEGQSFLLLHGGGGLETVASFGEPLATTHRARREVVHDHVDCGTARCCAAIPAC